MKKLLITILLYTIALAIPSGTHIVVSASEVPVRITINAQPCTSTGSCHYGGDLACLQLTPERDGWILPSGDILQGFYLAGSQEIVLPPNYGPEVLAHEKCHAWLRGQDIRVLQHFPTTPMPFNLAAEYSANDLDEDEARTCAAYQVRPDWLEQVSPERYEWAKAYLGR
jgi:hypothetical protein